MGVMIDIPMPENCEDCLICSLVPEHARLDMREHGLHYRLYCKVTGACVNGKQRDEACPLHEAKGNRKTGRWVYNSPVTMKCNQCGLVIKDWDWHRFKICPNCGADMRGKQDDSF